MQLRADQLTSHLEKTLAPLYVLHGDEPLLVIEAGDAIRAAARRKGYDEREVLVAGAGFKWDALMLAAGNMSLFGGNKLVDLRIPNGKPGRDGGEALQRYCDRLPEGVLTLVTLPQLDWAARKTGWFNALAQAGVAIELNAPGLAELPDWIARRLARQSQSAEHGALEFIAAHVEGNLLAAHQEIQKLALLYPAGNLAFDQVKDVVLNVARYDVYQLSDAMIAGDTARFQRILTGLQGEGTAPLLILATLAEQIRQLIIIRKGLDNNQPSAQLLQTARIWGERQKSVIATAKRINLQALMQGLVNAAEIDRMIKGVAQGDVWEGLLQLGLCFVMPGKKQF